MATIQWQVTIVFCGLSRVLLAFLLPWYAFDEAVDAVDAVEASHLVAVWVCTNQEDDRVDAVRRVAKGRIFEFLVLDFR